MLILNNNGNEIIIFLLFDSGEDLVEIFKMYDFIFFIFDYFSDNWFYVFWVNFIRWVLWMIDVKKREYFIKLFLWDVLVIDS
jgi:hypothetical protein